MPPAQGTEAITGDWQNRVMPEGVRTKLEPEGRRIKVEPKGWRTKGTAGCPEAHSKTSAPLALW